MYKEVEIDTNLYYLSEILLDLKYRKFDNDIIKVLNDLYDLVEEKIIPKELGAYNIISEEIIIKYFVEKW